MASDFTLARSRHVTLFHWRKRKREKGKEEEEERDMCERRGDENIEAPSEEDDSWGRSLVRGLLSFANCQAGRFWEPKGSLRTSHG